MAPPVRPACPARPAGPAARPFDVYKYLGTWYELAHYPSWFQRNDNYNTAAQYRLVGPDAIAVRNSTVSQGQPFASVGTARYLGGASFRVDFPPAAAAELERSGQFLPPPPPGSQFQPPPPPGAQFQPPALDPGQPNYVVDQLWVDGAGAYSWAAVTDPARQTFYLLSRTPRPAAADYGEVMRYVVAHFDRDRLVQTPHYC